MIGLILSAEQSDITESLSDAIASDSHGKAGVLVSVKLLLYQRRKFSNLVGENNGKDHLDILPAEWPAAFASQMQEYIQHICNTVCCWNYNAGLLPVCP